MSLLAFGVNHQTASFTVREKVSFSAAEVPSAMADLKGANIADEVVVLSTCNRTELYLGDVSHPKRMYEWLSDYRQIPLQLLKNHAYLYKDALASRHLFRVATGLDSVALGEPQILGQIKAAYQTSLEHKAVKQTLNRLFQEAFYVAKNVRSNTKLGENSISIAYAAIKLSEQFFYDYTDVTALVIGAGQTGVLASKILHKKGVGKILIANRTISKAQSLALEVNGYPMSIEQLDNHLHEADIIVSATGRGSFTVTANALRDRQKQRKHRMQLLLDLAVPRDIDPDVKKLSNSYLFGIDDLRNIIDKNQHLRQQAAEQAEVLIEEYNQHFNEWLQLRRHHHLLKSLHEFAQAEKQRLTERALKRIANGEDASLVMQELATRLTKKLTHHPSLLIRQASEKGQSDVLEAVKSIYPFD